MGVTPPGEAEALKGYGKGIRAGGAQYGVAEPMQGKEISVG